MIRNRPGNGGIHFIQMQVCVTYSCKDNWECVTQAASAAVWEEHLLRSLVTLSLAVDGRQCRFAVKLQSFPQGLPDLLRVCQHTRSCINSSPPLSHFGRFGLPRLPLSESLRGCDPMQMDRLSSSSSGGRLKSSHTHFALTPLRLDPSVSMPWSTLSCLEEQRDSATISTS